VRKIRIRWVLHCIRTITPQKFPTLLPNSLAPASRAASVYHGITMACANAAHLNKGFSAVASAGADCARVRLYCSMSPAEFRPLAWNALYKSQISDQVSGCIDVIVVLYAGFLSLRVQNQMFALF
jgi:hypothetical protein